LGLTGGRIVNKNTCIACRYWMQKEKNHKGEYVTDELIKKVIEAKFNK
jgi:hypothetical protein